MKYVIVVPDGMADRPLKELGGLTPLEASDTPNMDLVASNGSCGLAKTFYPGLPHDSSIANMGILGYDPRKYFTGRSPLEAANLGVTLDVGEISLRCNLVTVENDKITDFTAGHISNDEAKELIGVLGRRFTCAAIEFYPGVSYRNLLVIRKGLMPSVRFKSDPPHDIVGKPLSKHRIKAEKKSADDTVRLLNGLVDESREILEEHPINRRRIKEGKPPANSIWLWGEGVRPTMPKFQTMYGIKASLVSAVDLLKGIGRIAGLDVLDVKGATGYLDTNYEGKADAAIKSLESNGLTYVHMESTDEAGHEGNIEHKIRAIEDIDGRVLGRLLDRLEGEYRLLLMPDHATPIKVKTHTDEPVPYAIFDSEKDVKGAGAFTEKAVKKACKKAPTQSYRLMGKLLG